VAERRPAVLRLEADRRAAGRPGTVRPDVPRARGAPLAACRPREASGFEAQPPAASRGARALPPEEAVVASRASPPTEAAGVAEVSRVVLPEAAAVVGPPAWPREVAVAAERAAAVGAQHAAVAAGVALPAGAEAVAAEQRAWPREAEAAESRASRAAARPSVAASACRQDQLLPWPAPPLSARPARAIRSLRNASL